MSKRKSKEKKIIADLRRKLQSSHVTTSPTQTLTNKEKQTSSVYTHSFTPLSTYREKNIDSHTHLSRDIKKTGALTVSLLVVQIVLFFLLHTHIISIGNLTF